jgi:hypothetical protein
MSRPNPTKRIPNTRLGDVVMIRDESENFELLAFENLEAAELFEACLLDAGYGSARGGPELEWPEMERVYRTSGYRDWLVFGQYAISLAYMRYVSWRMNATDSDVTSNELNMSTVIDAYVQMQDLDYEILYPEEGVA